MTAKPPQGEGEAFAREVRLDADEQLLLAARRAEGAAAACREAAAVADRVPRDKALRTASSLLTRASDLLLTVKRHFHPYPPTKREGTARSVGQLIAFLNRFDSHHPVHVYDADRRRWAVEVRFEDGEVKLELHPAKAEDGPGA